MKRHATIVASLLLSISSSANSQQHVKLSTTSAKFNLSITSEPGRTFSTNDHFNFESATSKLFHTELSTHAKSDDADNAKSRVIVTSVNVERMENSDAAAAINLNDGGETTSPTAAIILESIVSVTFSDVGRYKAVKHAPIAGGWEDKTAPNVASILTKTVSTSDLLKVLIADNLVADDAVVLGLSFTEFDGSPNERGVTATETEIVSSQVNDGWHMFFAGVFISLLVVTIIGVGTWVYKKEFSHGLFTKKSNDDGSCDSVHYDGDIDLETATTASGVLGLKGHHPLARNDENAHPNSHAYRRKGGRGFSYSTDKTSNESIGQDTGCSPKTYKSGVMSLSSKNPLGITSMRKLDTFLTPQKPKSDRVPMYDLERLTRT